MEAAYAPDIAERLIRAGRPGEAIDWLKRSRRPFDDDDTTNIDLMVEALEALGKKNEAQDARWRYFEKSLNVDSLRAYLKRLPDFEDSRPSKRRSRCRQYASVDTALEFFVAWPNLQRADEMCGCARRNWMVALTINCAPRPKRWKTNIRPVRCGCTVAWLRAFCIEDRQSSTATRLGTFNRVSSWHRALPMRRASRSMRRSWRVYSNRTVGSTAFGADEAIICGFFVLCRSFLYQSVAEERFSSITLRVRNQVHHENERLSSVIYRLPPTVTRMRLAWRFGKRHGGSPRVARRIRYRADYHATSKPPITGPATRPSGSRCRTSPPRVHICTSNIGASNCFVKTDETSDSGRCTDDRAYRSGTASASPQLPELLD